MTSFNCCLQDTARELLRARRVRTEDKVNAVSIAVATYTKLVARKTSVDEAYAAIHLDLVLAAEISPGLCRDDLISSLQNYMYLWSGSESPARPAAYSETRSTYSSTVRSYEPRRPKAKADHNQSIKKAHCDSRSGISFLVDDQGDRITNAEDMAQLLKAKWEPVWSGSPASNRDMAAYLRSYKKKVRGIDTNISLADVINEILVKRNSCPGPNGIPFACYTELCDLAAPILLRVCRFLMNGGTPKAGFNSSLLFFLPKDGTGLPKNHRPIAASNTDNRIIANIVRGKLESSCHAIIDPRQTGFVRGRLIYRRKHSPVQPKVLRRSLLSV